VTVPFEQEPANVVVFTGNLHRPSKSRSLGEYLARRVAEQLPINYCVFDVLDAGRGLGAAYVRSELTPEALKVVDAVENADGLIAITPVYNGSFTGLFKHLFDFVQPLALVNTPVLIGATGGGHRHALSVEHQMRPLFGFFSAMTVATSVYAAESEFVDGEPVDETLLGRADQAVQQFAALLAHQQAVRHAQSRATAGK
jgi:FMN reductase